MRPRADTDEPQANLATGAVNLSLRTIYCTPVQSMLVLTLYTLGTLVVLPAALDHFATRGADAGRDD